MKNHYSITIKNTRKKTIRFISLFMILIIGLVLVYLGWLRQVNKAMLYGGVVVLFIVIDYFKLPEKSYFKMLAFTFQLTGWLALGYWWIGTAIVLLSVVEYEALKNQVIAFDANGVKLKGLFGNSYKWYELNNALVKDGLLTIDFKNNSILQAEILQNDENEFNCFCQEQLKQNALVIKA